mmetsp:Transcript_41371/g.41996  ORF Transcript_41371/g.41996 Transcript_41371/m.41996 type:complete len:211 (+) Transcript_41371:569-1201(+)
MEGKYIPTQASKTKKDAIRGYKMFRPGMTPEVKNVALAIPSVANASITEVVFSTVLLLGDALLVTLLKIDDPNKQLAMKHENTVPYGVATPSPNMDPIAAVIAGGHCNTKIYMAASKSAWVAPTMAIFLSLAIRLNASRMVTLVLSPSLFDATFSFQRNEANIPPRTRNTVDSSKGPVGPRVLAAVAASWPAMIATIESPAYAKPNVSPK